jgi:PKD repeat protein
MSNYHQIAPKKWLQKKHPLCLLFVLFYFSISTFAQTTPNFTINQTSGCVPLSGVNFTDASTGGVVTNRAWNLGNGTVIPNGAAIVGTNYLNAQKFYVTLTVTFSNGDIKTKKDSIIVHPRPKP